MRHSVVCHWRICALIAVKGLMLGKHFIVIFKMYTKKSNTFLYTGLQFIYIYIEKMQKFFLCHFEINQFLCLIIYDL